MRCFIAINIPEDIKEEILPVYEGLRTINNIKSVTPDKWHITLFFFANASEKEIKKIIKSIEEVDVEENIEVEIKGVGGFPNIFTPNVIWAGIKSKRIYDLYYDLKKRLIANNINFSNSKFKPHLTLARTRKNFLSNDYILLTDIIKQNTDMDFGRFIPTKLVLFKSNLTSRGPIYTEIYSKIL